MTTPIEQDITGKADALRKAWADAGRDGRRPTIHVLIAARPSPEDLAAWAEAGATELIWGVPDKSDGRGARLPRPARRPRHPLTRRS